MSFSEAGGQRYIGIAAVRDWLSKINQSTTELSFSERSPSICTLFIYLPLPVGEKRDAMLDCKDGKSGNGE